MAQRRSYVGRIHLGGGRYRWVGRFPTRKERDTAVARARVELERAHDTENTTVGEYATRFMDRYEKRRKHSSVVTIRYQLGLNADGSRAAGGFLERFGDRPLRSITRSEAENYADENGWRVPAIVTLFNAAVKSELLDRNRFSGLIPSSEGRSKQPPPTEAEFQALLDACDVLGGYGPRMRAFVQFLAFELMRPGEGYGLEWPDLDVERNRVLVQRRVYRGRVDTPKSNESKLIALTPPARDVVIGLPRDSRYVFTGIRGERLSSTTVRRYWRDVCIKAGVSFDLYHATKHYGVWYLWTRMNLSSRAIAAQAGWSVATVEKMLRVYGHADVGALEEIDRADFRNVRQLRSVQDAAGVA